MKDLEQPIHKSAFNLEAELITAKFTAADRIKKRLREC